MMGVHLLIFILHMLNSRGNLLTRFLYILTSNIVNLESCCTYSRIQLIASHERLYKA